MSSTESEEDEEQPFQPVYLPCNFQRTAPNLLITGTPGVGKSTLCVQLAEQTGLRWLELSKIALKYNFVEKSHESDKSPILKENALLRHIEAEVCEGGNVLEYHSASFIPKFWIDAVIVLRCNMDELHKRLEVRGYPAEKIADNVASELAEVSKDEAYENFRNVYTFKSNNSKQLKKAFNAACEQLQNFYDKMENNT